MTTSRLAKGDHVTITLIPPRRGPLRPPPTRRQRIRSWVVDLGPMVVYLAVLVVVAVVVWRAVR